MSKRSKSSRSKSRRITPWDDTPNPTPVQRFIKMHHQTRYEERHQPLDETGEAEMINSFEPSHCPYCGSTDFKKNGFDANGIRRYKCCCSKRFKPTTGTIFDSCESNPLFIENVFERSQRLLSRRNTELFESIFVRYKLAVRPSGKGRKNHKFGF